MDGKKKLRYWAGGNLRAEVTHLWNKGDEDGRHYVRLSLWDEQLSEMVVWDFALGTKEELFDRYWQWQRDGYFHAKAYGKVHIEKCEQFGRQQQ